MCRFVMPSIAQLSVGICKHTLVNEVLLDPGFVLGEISIYQCLNEQ